MRFDKQVELTGQAPVCPIELSDLVVGMNHLGWSPLSHEHYVLRRRSPFFWPLWILGETLLRLPISPSKKLKRALDVTYEVEARIDESGSQRTLHLHGRAPLSERRKLDGLLEALHRGRRWLTREGPLG
jgi:hypothetical protein